MSLNTVTFWGAYVLKALSYRWTVISMQKITILQS